MKNIFAEYKKNKKYREFMERLNKFSASTNCSVEYLLKYNTYRRKPKRLVMPGETRHTFSRCLRKSPLMKKNQMKELLVEVVEMALKKYEFEMIDYMIMNNHFHFIIKTYKDGPTLSRIMQYIKSQYAQRYNKIMGVIGPFWNERYGDTVIELSMDPKIYLFNLIWYLGYNPVDAGMVEIPFEYPYSGLNCYLNKNYKPRIPITLHPYFQSLGLTFSGRARKFLKYGKNYRKACRDGKKMEFLGELFLMHG